MPHRLRVAHQYPGLQLSVRCLRPLRQNFVRQLPRLLAYPFLGLVRGALFHHRLIAPACRPIDAAVPARPDGGQMLFLGVEHGRRQICHQQVTTQEPLNFFPNHSKRQG